MASINVRREGRRTIVRLTDEYSGLLLHLAKERGVSPAGRLLEAPVASAPRGQMRQAAEAWIRKQTAQALPAGDDPRDALIAALTDHIERLESTVAAQTREAADGFRRTLLAFAVPART